MAEQDFSIDTAAINAKYAALADDPRRNRAGSFRVPVEVQYRSEAFKQIARNACTIWINALRKQGWDLIGAPRVYGPRTAYDLGTGVVLLDKKEYLIHGTFILASTPKTERIEIPHGLVKRDPEHRIGLAEAVKAVR